MNYCLIIFLKIKILISSTKKKIEPLYFSKFLISSFFQLFIFVLIRIFFSNKKKIENKTVINTYFNYVNNIIR